MRRAGCHGCVAAAASLCSFQVLSHAKGRCPLARSTKCILAGLPWPGFPVGLRGTALVGKRLLPVYLMQQA